METVPAVGSIAQVLKGETPGAPQGVKPFVCVPGATPKDRAWVLHVRETLRCPIAALSPGW